MQKNGRSSTVRLKPVKDNERPPRMETRSSHYEKMQNQRNADNNKEWLTMKTLKPSHQKFCRDHKGSTVHKNGWTKTIFFYDLFAERTNTTKTLTKKLIPTEPSSEDQEAHEMSQHVLKEV